MVLVQMPRLSTMFLRISILTFLFPRGVPMNTPLLWAIRLTTSLRIQMLSLIPQTILSLGLLFVLLLLRILMLVRSYLSVITMDWKMRHNGIGSFITNMIMISLLCYGGGV